MQNIQGTPTDMMLGAGNRVPRPAKPTDCCPSGTSGGTDCPCPQPSVVLPTDLTALSSTNYGEGQLVYVTSLHAFFAFDSFAGGSPPAVDNITVVATDQGGDTRWLRQL